MGSRQRPAVGVSTYICVTVDKFPRFSEPVFFSTRDSTALPPRVPVMADDTTRKGQSAAFVRCGSPSPSPGEAQSGQLQAGMLKDGQGVRWQGRSHPL